MTRYEEAKVNTAWKRRWYEEAVRDEAAVKQEMVARGLLPDTSKLCPLCIVPQSVDHAGECTVELEPSC